MEPDEHQRAIRLLASYQAAAEQDPAAVLQALALAQYMGQPAPGWAMKRLADAISDWQHGDAKTLDEALGLGAYRHRQKMPEIRFAKYLGAACFLTVVKWMEKLNPSTGRNYSQTDSIEAAVDDLAEEFADVLERFQLGKVTVNRVKASYLEYKQLI